jgi:hypothetical protein
MTQKDRYLAWRRDGDVRQARGWRSWWCTLLYVDASASTLLSLSVGCERDVCTSMSTPLCPWRVEAGRRIAFVLIDLSLYTCCHSYN